jgi:acetyl esterase/lipase
MAPDHAFPQAHNDCFQVYRFLTTQLHKYMRIKPVNIFVGGDSAGANLSCAITTFALKNQLIIPKALYLAYPLLNV